MHNILRSSKFGQIGPQTTELDALERLNYIDLSWENLCHHFFSVVSLHENNCKYFDDFTFWLSGERSLPFWLPVDFQLIERTLNCIYLYSKGTYSHNIQVRVMTLVHDTFSYHALQMYKVASKYLKLFSSYRVDTIV